MVLAQKCCQIWKILSYAVGYGEFTVCDHDNIDCVIQLRAQLADVTEELVRRCVRRAGQNRTMIITFCHASD